MSTQEDPFRLAIKYTELSNAKIIFPSHIAKDLKAHALHYTTPKIFHLNELPQTAPSACNRRNHISRHTYLYIGLLHLPQHFHQFLFPHAEKHAQHISHASDDAIGVYPISSTETSYESYPPTSLQSITTQTYNKY